MLDVHKIGIPAQITLISECWIGTKVLGNSHWIYPPSIFWFGLAPTLHHQLGRAEPVSFWQLVWFGATFLPPFFRQLLEIVSRQKSSGWVFKNAKKSYMIVCHLNRKFFKEKALTLSSKCCKLFMKDESLACLKRIKRKLRSEYLMARAGTKTGVWVRYVQGCRQIMPHTYTNM